MELEDTFPKGMILQALILDIEKNSDIWLLVFHPTTPQKEDMASNKRYTRSNLDTEQTPS
jgi:hypothetical protein